MIIKSYFIFESLQQAKSLLKLEGIPEDDKDFLSLKELLKSNIGYIGWFTKMHFSENVSMQELTNLYSIIIQEPEIINGLKNTLISYTNWESLMDDIISSRNLINIKRILNQFPREQKLLIDIKNDKESSLLLKLYSFKDKANFINKISRYKNKKDLLNAINLFTTDERKTGYKNIKDRIVNSKSRIVYDSHFDDIIICEVNFGQLVKLASDTSWCILSEHTFNSYADGINKQYIMFLTDKTGNKSKIGITYGLHFKTAHAINDSFVSENEVRKILEERGSSISILKRSVEELIKDQNLSKASVDVFMRNGFSKKDILKYKQSFTKQELDRYFTKTEIDEYKLNDKLQLRLRDIDNNVDFIIKNSNRIIEELEIHNLLDIKPISRITELSNIDIISEEGKLFLNEFLKNEKNFKNHKYLNEDIRTFVFILKYYDIDSNEYTLSDINTLISKDKMSFSNLDILIKYLKESGFKLDDSNICYDIINKLEIKMFYFDRPETKRIDSWVPLVEKIPCIKEKVKEMLISLKDRRSLGEPFSEISDITCSIIKKHYPDISDEIISRRSIARAFKTIHNVLPNAQYQGSGIGRRETIEYMKSKGREERIITPDQYYEDFYHILKDASWPSAYNHGSECLSTFAMILTLCKRNEYEKIGKLNIRWTDEFTGKLIRVALDITHNNRKFYSYNGSKYVPDIYLLTNEEKEKLFTYLLANIKDKVYHNVSNTILDVEMNKHMTFSLVYYIYGWGFNNYLRAAENSKSIYKESWDKNIVTRKKLRFEYLEYIFKYLAFINDINGAKDLIDSIMNWKLTKTELKEVESFFLRHFDNDQSKIISDYIFGKYFPIENKKTHLRDNRSYW